MRLPLVAILLGVVVSVCAQEKTFPRGLPKVELERVLPELKLDRPVWMEEGAGGKVFFVEQRGRIVTVAKGSNGSNEKEFFNIVDRKPFVDNEEGLLGLAFHPGFATNKLFYVYYTGHDPRRSVISEFKVGSGDAADLASERVVMEVAQPYGNHNGGQVSFGPDGFLYITLGDGGAGNDPHNNGQNMAVLLGKILRIDVNTRATMDKKQLGYGIPQDNPFVNLPFGVRSEILAYGLRNVWRFSWDRETGELYAGEVGQNLWEEVNIIAKGGNYGWCVREAFHPFKPGPKEGRYDEPIAEYPHNPQIASQSPFAHEGFGLSITGGYVYRGTKQAALRGVYVYGDYSLGTVFGLTYKNGKVTDQAILLQQPKNIMSFAEDREGELYLLAQDGGIYHVVVASGK
ncbi:MAG TPA: PQQ-dependent sugar dehydrogenase [Verrucomicrobiae bacterium]|nr:PQQ-dependent sugar dehydrogenase [Verrucomicrobiae bacterium]